MEDDKIILFKEKQDCSGCAACYAICPNHAIQMQADEEGFLYPQIDEKLCVGCAKCICVCAMRE